MGLDDSTVTKVESRAGDRRRGGAPADGTGRDVAAEGWLAGADDAAGQEESLGDEDAHGCEGEMECGEHQGAEEWMLGRVVPKSVSIVRANTAAGERGAAGGRVGSEEDEVMGGGSRVFVSERDIVLMGERKMCTQGAQTGERDTLSDSLCFAKNDVLESQCRERAEDDGGVGVEKLCTDPLKCTSQTGEGAGQEGGLEVSQGLASAAATINTCPVCCQDTTLEDSVSAIEVGGEQPQIESGSGVRSEAVAGSETTPGDIAEPPALQNSCSQVCWHSGQYPYPLAPGYCPAPAFGGTWWGFNLSHWLGPTYDPYLPSAYWHTTHHYQPAVAAGAPAVQCAAANTAPQPEPGAGHRRQGLVESASAASAAPSDHQIQLANRKKRAPRAEKADKAASSKGKAKAPPTAVAASAATVSAAACVSAGRKIPESSAPRKSQIPKAAALCDPAAVKQLLSRTSKPTRKSAQEQQESSTSDCERLHRRKRRRDRSGAVDGSGGSPRDGPESCKSRPNPSRGMREWSRGRELQQGGRSSRASAGSDFSCSESDSDGRGDRRFSGSGSDNVRRKRRFSESESDDPAQGRRKRAAESREKRGAHRHILGHTIPCSVSIVGRNTAGALDLQHISCVACGRRGHLAWECPARFFAKLREPCPGFDEEGNRLPECWEGELSITEETRKAWRRYLRRHFEEPARAWANSTGPEFEVPVPCDKGKLQLSSLGRYVPCAVAVIGANTKGALNRAAAKCSGCGQRAAHLFWECPKKLCDLFGEPCPGFDTEGNRRPECWREGLCITTETRAAWQDYLRRQFGLTSADSESLMFATYRRQWTLGTTIPCAACIVGANTVGAVARACTVCSACRREGHLTWECPVRLYELFGEACPGFDADGERRAECWEGPLLITEETRQAWRGYVRRRFAEPAPAKQQSTTADFARLVTASGGQGSAAADEQLTGTLGLTVPCALMVVGANTKGAVDSRETVCFGCERVGHFSWECPAQLCDLFGEPCPGFDAEGNQLPECWREGLCITTETRAVWRTYLDLHFQEAVRAHAGSTGADFEELPSAAPALTS